MANPTVIFFDLGDTLIFSEAGGASERYPDALDVLQTLQERGYRLGLLSNQSAGTTVTQVFNRLNQLGLAAYIERELITISTEIPGNAGKPDRSIFNLALQKARHAAASAQSIFITEELSHVQAARGFGWRAILKRNAGACVPSDGECVVGLSSLLNLLPKLGDTAGTNLHLAPPPKLVDGLWAVPMDIQRITAVLTFDAATQTGTGDATLDFKLGNYAGNPIFDLRQTITAAWLDGVSFPLAQLAHHDFGGGAQAQLRVIDSALDAGSTHSLRVNYTLGVPQASAAGSYQPAITWSPGPRLAFNFGFTDLGPGRYLESWIPANLIFDQFILSLELRLTNSTITHRVITNGTVTDLGANHWRVDFPSRFAALSPLLELRASDSLASASGVVTLPVSGQNVMVEAWKLASGAADLPTQVNNIKGWLSDNENSSGTYLHGNRFVAFVHVGGMEYEGATTSSPASLKHEAFHSWFARGLKPASQPDAWWDEAWTTYHDRGASVTTPFDFTALPVELCTRNPWSRITAGNSYLAGERFWRGVAALLGLGNIKNLMRDFYLERRARPVTTTDLEEYLIQRSGNSQLVDAFHRFVYGFADPSPLPDLWLRDDPVHTGTEAWAGRFWDSPDLWVRNRDDGGLTHQAPEFGQDNWFYARVRNRGTGTARHFVVTFNVKGFAGTEFIWPMDFLPCVAAASGFDLPSGATYIVKARWPRAFVPPVGTHACLTAAVLARSDAPVTGRHVWEHNNLAQKNLTIVDLAPNGIFVLPFVVTNFRSQVLRRLQLELVRPSGLNQLSAALLNRSPQSFPGFPADRFLPLDFAAASDKGIVLLDCAGLARSDAQADADDAGQVITLDAMSRLRELFDQGVERPFKPGATMRVPIAVPARKQLVFGLKLQVPANAQPGQTLRLDLVERDIRGNKLLGGIAVQINVR